MWDRQTIMQKNTADFVAEIAKRAGDAVSQDALNKSAKPDTFIGWQLPGRFMVCPIGDLPLERWARPDSRKGRGKDADKTFTVTQIPIINLLTEELIYVDWHRLRANLSYKDIKKTPFESSFNDLEDMSMADAFKAVEGKTFYTKDGECHGSGIRAFYKLFSDEE